MQGLAELDVQQSLKATIETLTRAAREVDADLAASGGKLSPEARATLDLISKKVEEAESFFARALDSKELYDLLTDIHRRTGDAAGAERFARQGRMFLADELEFKGRLEAFYGNNTRALSHFDEALKLIPDHAFALKGKEGALKRVEKSKKDLAKLSAAAQSKRTAKDFVALGSAHADLGHLDEAMAAFEEAVKVEPGNPDAWARKGTAHHAKGQVKEALEMYRKALEIKPTSMTGRRGVNYATFQIENPAGRPAEP